MVGIREKSAKWRGSAAGRTGRSQMPVHGELNRPRAWSIFLSETSQDAVDHANKGWPRPRRKTPSHPLWLLSHCTLVNRCPPSRAGYRCAQAHQTAALSRLTTQSSTILRTRQITRQLGLAQLVRVLELAGELGHGRDKDINAQWLGRLAGQVADSCSFEIHFHFHLALRHSASL